jgi:hypothetical protein
LTFSLSPCEPHFALAENWEGVAALDREMQALAHTIEGSLRSIELVRERTQDRRWSGEAAEE